MTRKLAAIILYVFITLVFSAFYKGEHKPSKGIKFKQLTSTIKTDTSATIEVIIDNGERERTILINCTTWPDSLVLRANIEDWYRNFSKTFTATIPIK